MGEGHSHSHAHGAPSPGASGQAAARHKRNLARALAVIATFCVIEVVAGLVTKSLALLSDAGHMVTDVLGLGMALAAVHAAGVSTANRQRSFGLYRLEILAALANAVLLLGVAGYVLWEAIERFREPVRVLGVPMLVVGVAELAANVVAFLLLREGSKESLNVQGAYLEVMADTLGSLGCCFHTGAAFDLTAKDAWDQLDATERQVVERMAGWVK